MKTKEREELEEQVQRSFNRDHKDNLILSPNMDPDPLQTVPPLFQNDVAFFDPDRQSLSTPRRMTSKFIS